MKKYYLSDKERFESYVRLSDDNECWTWEGATNPKGYGRFGIKNSFGKWVLHYAHRVSYEYFVGPIPFGQDVLHSCNNPSCVNPKHLHLGDDSVNKREAYRDGLMSAVGEKNGQAILNEESVCEIRSSAASNWSLAKKYGVHPNTISAVRTYRSWSHI